MDGRSYGWMNECLLLGDARIVQGEFGTHTLLPRLALWLIPIPISIRILNYEGKAVGLN